MAGLPPQLAEARYRRAPGAALMLAAPFGIAAGAKAAAPAVPLWALVVGAQAIDILFVILHLTGIEGRGGALLYAPGNSAMVPAPYSHALPVTLVLALLA